MQISDEMVADAALRLMAHGVPADMLELLIYGDGLGNARPGALRAALEAVAPMIRAAALDLVMLYAPTTSARPGDSDWARGFYECQMQWSATIRKLGRDDAQHW
jgi:hypothetical protein